MKRKETDSYLWSVCLSADDISQIKTGHCCDLKTDVSVSSDSKLLVSYQNSNK